MIVPDDRPAPPTAAEAPRRRGPGLVVRILFSLVLAGFVAFSGGALLLLGAIWHFGRGLPDYQQLATYVPAAATRTYAADGQLLAHYASEDRQFVPIANMPPLLVAAFIAAEDQHFREHPGLDFLGIARAVVQNIGNIYSGRRIIGASTITQQLAKTFFLTSSISLERKAREAILALRIERTLSKDRILELYLNEIYLGVRSYGVAAAARNYFGKPLDDLSLADIAFLAGLPKGPNNYHPDRNPSAARARRAYVLRRMAEDGIVSPQQAAIAGERPVMMVAARPEEGPVLAPHFAEEVRRWAEAAYGADELYGGGLTITTTLDPALQRVANEALRDGLEDYDRRHGYRGPAARFETADGDWRGRLAGVALPTLRANREAAVVLEVEPGALRIGFADGSRGWVDSGDMAWALPDEGRGRPSLVFHEGDVILVEPLPAGPGTLDRYALRQVPAVDGALVALDPRNGRVLALVGGYTFDGSGFNRATQAWRQPGSAFKPFVYLAALEAGYTPASLVLDAPLVFEEGGEEGEWRPQNYFGTFFGPSTLRTGLERSRNVMTVRLANTIGIDRVVAVSERFGIGSPEPVLSTALGSAETSPLALAAAYAALANGGRRVEPAFVERVQDRAGLTLHARDARACEGCRGGRPDGGPPSLAPTGEAVTDPVRAFQIAWMLKGAAETGTARTLTALERPLAGKTGTTNDFRDAWFVGFSPELVVCVFVGFDQPESLGEGETGGRVAVPIFESFMRDALAGRAPKPFRVPDGVDMVRIDADTGQRPDAASRRVIFEAFARGTGPNPDAETIGGFEDEIY